MFKIFKKYPLLIKISQKKDGSMRFGEIKETKKILKNRLKFFKKIGIDKNSLVMGGLCHKNKVKIVSLKDKGKTIKNTDGLLTKESNLFLGITVADCLPIFLYEPQKNIVGILHCGWRNLSGIIIKNAFKKIFSLGAKKEKILVGIGPSICQKHFEIKKDVFNKFKSYSQNVVLKKKEKFFLDLKEIAKIQFLTLGIKPKNIEISKECTFCLKEKYFSFRREKPKVLKAMIAIIGIKNKLSKIKK